MAFADQKRHRGLRFLRDDKVREANGNGETAVARIAVIVVSWNDSVEVEACIEALSAARRRAAPAGPEVSLVLVDNGGHLGERERIRSLWPDARWIVNEKNRGLAPAANQGAAVAQGDVLLFVNPDTRAEGDPYTQLSLAFAHGPKVVAVAPRLLEDSGSANGASRRLAPPDREDQFTFQLRRLPALVSDARHLLLIDHLWPNNAGRRRERYADFDREVPFAVEQAAGAALAVRRDAFVAAGGFDERFTPAWFEDVDLCDRLAREGTILYWPHARFRHAGGTSSRQLGYARFLPIFYRNALRYRQRYSPWARLIYRVLLATGMVLRLAALPFRPHVPRPRGEAAKGYLKTLAVALGSTARESSDSLGSRLSA